MKKLLKYSIFIVLVICATVTVDVMAAEIRQAAMENDFASAKMTAVTGTASVADKSFTKASKPTFSIRDDENVKTEKLTMKKNQNIDLDTKIKKVDGDKNKYTVTWKSSNEKVAVVNKKGTITAKKHGTTTITAVIDGTDIKNKVKVTVKENTVLKYGSDYDKEVTASSLKKESGATVKDNAGNLYKKGERIGNFVLTGYCTQCNSGYGRGTATGKTATAGITVAVNKKQISLGTKLIIGDHVYVAQDIHGNHRYDKVIDVFFGTRHGAEPLLKNIPVYLAVE